MLGVPTYFEEKPYKFFDGWIVVQASSLLFPGFLGSCQESSRFSLAAKTCRTRHEGTKIFYFRRSSLAQQ